MSTPAVKSAAASSTPRPVCIANTRFETEESLKPFLALFEKHFSIRKAKATTGALRGATLRFVKTATRSFDVCARVIQLTESSEAKTPIQQQVRELNFDSQGAAKLICCVHAKVSNWQAIGDIQADLHPDVGLLCFKDASDFVRLILKQLRALQPDTQAAVKAACTARDGAAMDTERTAQLLADCTTDMDGKGDTKALAFEITTALHGIGSVSQLAGVSAQAVCGRSAMTEKSAQRLVDFLHGSDRRSSRED